MMQPPTQAGNEPRFDENLRALEQMGFRIQGTRRIRDVEEDLIAKLEGIHNATTYIAKVQLLMEFYATAAPYVSSDVGQKIADKFKEAKLNAPSFATHIVQVGTSGAALCVKISRATNEEMFLPLGPSDHLRIMMAELRENCHWTIFNDLVTIKGDVEKDLEEKGVIRKAKGRKPATVGIDLDRAKSKR